MISTRHLLTAMIVVATSTTALAESTARLLSWSGTEINLTSGEFSDILTSPGTGFSTADMNEVNSVLQNDGIQTEGRISIMLAQTGAGLSILTMFDGVETIDPPGTPTVVTAQAVVPLSATWQYNIDAGGTFDVLPAGNELLLSGAFNWNSGVDSEAMAVSNLDAGQEGSFFLNQIVQGGLINESIQFLTMEAGVWTQAELLEFIPDENGGPDFEYITFDITSIPSPAGFMLLGLAGSISNRRRRR